MKGDRFIELANSLLVCLPRNNYNTLVCLLLYSSVSFLSKSFLTLEIRLEML
jgi:hypothetical protein